MATLLSANLPANTEPVSASAGECRAFCTTGSSSKAKHRTAQHWPVAIPFASARTNLAPFICNICKLCLFPVHFACAQLLGWSRDIDYDSCVCTVTRSTAGADSVHHCYKSVGTTGGHN